MQDIYPIPKIEQYHKKEVKLNDIKIENIFMTRSAKKNKRYYDYINRIELAGKELIKWKRSLFDYKSKEPDFSEKDCVKIKKVAIKYNIKFERLYQILLGF